MLNATIQTQRLCNSMTKRRVHFKQILKDLVNNLKGFNLFNRFTIIYYKLWGSGIYFLTLIHNLSLYSK